MNDSEQHPRSFSTEEQRKLWDRVKITIEAQEQRKQIQKVSIAAIIIVLLSIGGVLTYYTRIKPDIYFAQNANLLVELKDGSTVTLFKGATLKIEKSFPADTRDVYLEGNALFDVAKSKEHPFIVHGPTYETKVLGTVFKVIQHGNTFSVDLYEGKVAVSEKGKNNAVYFLKPDQTFNNYGSKAIATVTHLQDNVKKSDNPDANDKKSITDNADLHFRLCKVSDAIPVIENMFQIKIEYPEDYKNNEITTDLMQSSKDEVLQTLTAYLNLKLTKNDRMYKLEK